jgi:hypothetical protein
MLRFDRTKQPIPGFSLDRRDHVRRRTLQRREWRLLLTMPIALVLMAVLIHMLNGYRELLHDGPDEPVIVERTLSAMPPARLADAADLPSAAAIAAVSPEIRSLMADRAIIRHDDELDAVALAWADLLLAADRTAPPIPQRVIARDLVLGGVMPGAAVTLHGRLIDSIAAPVAGGETRQRLVLELDEQQQAVVIADATAGSLTIGRPIQILGRYLGPVVMPSGDASAKGTTLMPLIAARTARPDASGPSATEPDLEEMRGGVPAQLPTNLYDDLSDERMVLESRPYYYLLGQAKIDADAPANLADADSGNLRADDIHQDPPTFRGRPFTVTGTVYRTWEDPNVRRDQPFGVARVQRMLLWSRDMGKITEQVDGKAVLKSQILRLYEVCVSGDQPVPARGERVAITGRFFKFRAIPVQPDALRDQRNRVVRQSDHVYTFVFVAAGYRLIPPPPRYELGSFDVIAAVVTISLVGLLFFLRRRDKRLEEQVGGQIRQLRKTRLALKSPASTEPPSTTPTDSPT